MFMFMDHGFNLFASALLYLKGSAVCVDLCEVDQIAVDKTFLIF